MCRRRRFRERGQKPDLTPPKTPKTRSESRVLVGSHDKRCLSTPLAQYYYTTLFWVVKGNFRIFGGFFRRSCFIWSRLKLHHFRHVFARLQFSHGFKIAYLARSRALSFLLTFCNSPRRFPNPTPRSPCARTRSKTNRCRPLCRGFCTLASRICPKATRRAGRASASGVCVGRSRCLAARIQTTLRCR